MQMSKPTRMEANAPKTTLKFYVGNTDEADFIFTLNN